MIPVDELPPEEDKRPYKRRRTCSALPVKLTGSWEDVGHGTCQRCRTARRLYRPCVLPELKVCCKCSQVYANSALVDRGGEPVETLEEKAA